MPLGLLCRCVRFRVKILSGCSKNGNFVTPCRIALKLAVTALSTVVHVLFIYTFVFSFAKDSVVFVDSY